jgi:hypothetical protein
MERMGEIAEDDLESFDISATGDGFNMPPISKKFPKKNKAWIPLDARGESTLYSDEGKK